MEQWKKVSNEEKILAFIDTSERHEAKEGIFFTNQGIVWKEGGSSRSLAYPELNIYTSGKIGGLLRTQDERAGLAELIWQLHNRFNMA